MDTLRLPVDEEEVDVGLALAGTGEDEELVGRSREGHVPLGSRQRHPVVVSRRGELHAGGAEPSLRLHPRPTARAPGRDAKELRLLLVAARRSEHAACHLR